MASIAVLPILIGLAVDYAIQFQARFDEALGDLLSHSETNSPSPAQVDRGRPSRRGRRRPHDRRRLPRHRRRLPRPPALAHPDGPQLRPPPSRSASASPSLLALTAGFAALALRRKSPGDNAPLGRVAPGEGPRTEAQPPPAGLSPGDRTRPSERLLSLALSHPQTQSSASASPWPVIGWGVGTQIETVSDVRSLAPQSSSAVQDLNDLQDTTGVSGELDVSVEAPDLTDPATIDWMADFKQRVLARQRLQRRKPELPRRRRLPGPGALGLPHPRWRAS